MESWFQALTLGIVQGLTEFLPISSSAHIYLLASILKWEDPGAAFTAVVQIGTELAVVVYFRSEIWHLLRSLFAWFFVPAKRNSSDSRLAWTVVLGSLPIGVLGLALRSIIENDVRNFYLIACMLIVFGIILILIERTAVEIRQSELNFRTGILMGFAQALALVPGVSRSGATISMGLWLGLERRVATRYAFLLAIPAVFASGLLELTKLDESPISWGPTLLATITSFFVGLAVISGLLRFLANHTFTAFGWYRIALGLSLLTGAYLGIFN